MSVRNLIVLVTERLKLRPFCEKDWKAVHEYAVDPEISRFQDWGPNTVKDTKEFVAKCMNSSENETCNDYFFSITLPISDRHIGGCILTINSAKMRSASIGYTISRKYWGVGYATEAAEALLGFAFCRLGLRKVSANCDAGNAASWKVMEKIGMRLTHSELNSRFFKGEWRDWLEYTITDTEWQKLCHTG